MVDRAFAEQSCSVHSGRNPRQDGTFEDTPQWSYRLTTSQQCYLLETLLPHMSPKGHGRSKQKQGTVNQTDAAAALGKEKGLCAGHPYPCPTYPALRSLCFHCESHLRRYRVPVQRLCFHKSGSESSTDPKCSFPGSPKPRTAKQLMTLSSVVSGSQFPHLLTQECWTQ